ncbi:MAG TPA: C40 family peptidase [Actinophytocola sp.]|uniref:C40 family peptidase n=1 Tax=Actinophytocola sp. TaxID=1872138 RepID=UPI002DBD36CD|nr:C40 family peptidase [Actinophytocola sp.]HEU5475966.1 C40 family peptidase [Actinophytocola sp.]
MRRAAVPLGVVALIGVLAPGPALAQPTTVAGLLGHYYDLSAEAEKVNEQLLRVQEDLARKRAESAAATEAATAAKAAAEELRSKAVTARADMEKVTALLAGRNTRPGLSAFIGGANRDAVLARMEAATLAGQVSGRAMVVGGNAVAEADRAAEEANRALDTAHAAETEVATGAAEVEQHKGELESQIAEVRRALDRLTPDQRALLSTNEFSGTDVKIPAGDVGAVLRFALNQMGKPYLWGAVGPAAYDCSGLVQTSYRVGGVLLPRVSIDQSGVGQQVLRHDVRPGDLIFYYQPVHHVAIAVDNLRALHAPSFGQTVKLAGIDAIGPITVIRRVMK